jgi:glycerol kinase
LVERSNSTLIGIQFKPRSGLPEAEMKRAILSIDQGTTSSRALVIDAMGTILGIAQRPITPTYPQAGWVNQDADELWEVTLQVAQNAVALSGLAPNEIVGIGIANQRETTVLWDRATGRPVAPAIVWQSRQSASLVNAIVARDKAMTYQRVTGLVPDAYFSATKIAWVLEQDPELRRRAEAGELLFGTVDSWLMWNLSAGKSHVTDYANASRTMLFDIRSGEWSDELLSDLSIPACLLPTVVENSALLFETDSDLFGEPIPVAGVAGDQQAALFGQTCFQPGEAKNTYGTGSFLLMNTGAEAVKSECNLLTTIGWSIGGERQYALEGAIFVTGSAVQWLRDGLGIIKESVEVEALASSVPDSHGVVFVPALVGLGAPFWDQGARGTILGITRGSTAAHIARATLEAIALRTRDVLDAMATDSGVSLSELRVDGGAVQNDLLMQIQADVLGVPVVRPVVTETTAFGAAYLAGLATGVWSTTEEIRERWQEDRRFEPRMSASERDRLYGRWRDAVERSRSWESPS